MLYLENPAQGKYFGSMITENATGTLSYNGLLLTALKRLSNGVTVQANYTYSHCIDMGTAQLISIPMIAGIAPAQSREDLRGNCTTLEANRKQNFNLTTVYITPRFSTRAARIIGSGWQIAGILRIYSGDYFSLSSGLDQALTGTDDQRPQQVLTNPYCSNKGVSCWLNPAAFAQPATGTYGNMGPGTIEGPGFFGIDINVTRSFKVREKQSLQVRGEAFNITNHVNLLDPVTTLNSSTFGQILSANDPRILQLALKYVF